jgi:16S rRNA A1518/A1519 N6-dimethyltransferase RsmA/KsgA/DIM1 with predicted DNA glycosylase/AP lyase activity
LPYKPHTIGTRDRLRGTFDRVAQQYDQNRPAYPSAVFDDVVRISGVATDSHLLDIGCGTGHATAAFAARGYRIDAIELGENMADLARQRLAEYPRVAIVVADFDTL